MLGIRSKWRRFRVSRVPPLLVTMPAISLSAIPMGLPARTRDLRISLAASAAAWSSPNDGTARSSWAPVFEPGGRAASSSWLPRGVKPADDRGSDCATAKQEFHGVGLALTGEVIDEGIRIGDGHRQFARVFLV